MNELIKSRDTKIMITNMIYFMCNTCNKLESIKLITYILYIESLIKLKLFKCHSNNIKSEIFYFTNF